MTGDPRVTANGTHLQGPQKGQAVEVLTRAFFADPEYVLLFPDAAERSRSLASLWRGVLAYSLSYGLVQTTPAVQGIACWLVPGKTEVTFWRALRTGFALPRAVMGFQPQARERFLSALAQLDETRKHLMPRPHWYLWALGVHPDHQGQGIASWLLAPVLACADAEGQPCYLEALTEPNVAFYRKRGFEVAREAGLPGQQIRFWAMVRQPGS